MNRTWRKAPPQRDDAPETPFTFKLLGKVSAGTTDGGRTDVFKKGKKKEKKKERICRL